MTWREENEWTTRDELVATLIETVDKWGRIESMLLRPKNPRDLPKPIRIPRPEHIVELERQERRKRIETDPAVIARWFAQRPK